MQTPPPPPPPPPAQSVAPRRALRQQQQPPPPPAPVVHRPGDAYTLLYGRAQANLPADGQELVKSFLTDVEAIEREADQKIAARREAAVKALETLQQEHTKAGRLDEATAIRNYLRSGFPTAGRSYWIRKR